MPLHDITRPAHADLPPWPGDTPYDYRLTWRMDTGGSVNVGAFTSSTHHGTHADAPFHFLADGARIDAIDPAVYWGPALVADVSGVGWSITREILGAVAPQLRGDVTRLLLKTGA